MRALVLVLLLARGAVAQGFDHNLHARDLFTSGGEALPCTRCHTVQNGMLVGRPDHAACFGACHGPAPKGQRGAKPVAADATQQRLCSNCHSDAALGAVFTGRVPAAFPPYVPTDFALAANHKSHATAACSACHVTGKPAAHRRCLGCHDGSKAFAMTACTSCHTPGSGQPLPPHLAEPTVTAAFSHKTHAARGGKGAQCVTCHAQIRETNDNILPRTQAQACATSGCHDGAPVFAITASCTRCHTTAPAKFEQVRRDTRFSHATHANTLPCVGCHVVGANEILTIGHAPCATCHADDFTQREPLYCSACHNSTEPWRKLTADRGPAERTEFGSVMDHALPAHQRACTTCHVLTTADSQLRPPRGHRACTGAGCHTSKSGPAPLLSACEACHQRGAVTTRTAERTAAPWSVRTTFQHRTHTKDREGAALPCTTCHAGPLATIATATPAKATCVACHDGATAFKLTGTGCTRCHPGAK